MNHYEVKGQTMNKDVHALLAIHCPTAKTATKKHISGIGYVFFIRDEAGKTLAKVYKVDGGYCDGNWIPTHMKVTVN